MVKSPPLTLLDSSCITGAVHALDNLFATPAKNCAKSGIIETEEPPELLSHIATDLIIHELYVRCSQTEISRCVRGHVSMPRSRSRFSSVLQNGSGAVVLALFDGADLDLV